MSSTDNIRESVSTAYADALGHALERGSSTSFGCGDPVAFAGLEAGQTVVDLGAGAGFDLLVAAEKVGPGGRVIGVDMTDEMIAAARANAARAGVTNIELRKGFIEELPLEAKSVDWVISNCVINLSPDKPTVFAEIQRVLRPGGRFSISDMVADELPDWVRQTTEAYAACIGGTISEQAYVEGLRAAGLDDVEVVDRLIYDADQLHALIADQLDAFSLPEELVRRGIDEVAGKVASIKVTGRRAPAS